MLSNSPLSPLVAMGIWKAGPCAEQGMRQHFQGSLVAFCLGRLPCVRDPYLVHLSRSLVPSKNAFAGEPGKKGFKIAIF